MQIKKKTTKYKKTRKNNRKSRNLEIVIKCKLKFRCRHNKYIGNLNRKKNGKRENRLNDNSVVVNGLQHTRYNIIIFIDRYTAAVTAVEKQFTDMFNIIL